MIDNQDKQMMIQCRNKGMSYPKIAKLFGITHGVVIYHLKNPDRPVQTRYSKGGHEIKDKSVPLYTLKPDLKDIGIAVGELKNVSPKLQIKPQVAFIGEPKFVEEGKNYSYRQILNRQKKVKLVRDEVGNIIK